MSIVSYAQNFEDVMLRRALKHLEHGFYIDVGAWSPEIDSVTRTFYELGWHGINIEPNPNFHNQLSTKRPLDINLQLAVGDCEEVAPFIIIGDTGLSTMNERVANKHQPLGYTATRHDVNVTTLHAIWRRYVPAGQDVHFLKVDVEGGEKAVLAGCDWTTCRPWIVVVEATEPLEQTETYADWETILLGAQYTFAYADGLNRFYVADEHANLMAFFRYPPNVFDDFVLSGQRSAEEDTRQALARAQTAEEQLQQALEGAQRSEERVRQALDGTKTTDEQTGARIEQIEPPQPVAAMTQSQADYPSLSMPVTKLPMNELNPLSKASLTLRKGLNRIIHLVIETCQRPLSRLMVAVLQRTSLSQRINQILHRYPALHQHLLDVAERNGVMRRIQDSDQAAHNSTRLPSAKTLTSLSPRGLEIYKQLKNKIENQKGGK